MSEGESSATLGSAVSGRLKVATWNVNGLRAVVKRGDLAQFLAAEAPDVLLLQEIKMNEAIPGFSDYVKFDSFAMRKGYSGTAVWVRSDGGALVRAEGALPDLTDKYGNLFTEGRVTTVRYREVNFVSVYVPNSKQDLTRLGIRQKWDRWFKAYLDGLDGPVVAGGDFNVAATELDLARPKENRGKHGFTDEERAGFAEFLSDYRDVWRDEHPGKREYSWWSHYAHARENNVGWRIDYLLARGVRVERARILGQVLGSDHVPVMAEVVVGGGDGAEAKGADGGHEI